MNREKELQFAKTLEGLKEQAKEGMHCISQEMLDETFAPFELSEEQMNLVHEFLNENKIGIGEPVDLDDYLGDEEKDYLDTYLQELEELEAVKDGEKEAITLSAMAGDADAQNRLIEIFLPEVVQIAKLYAGQGVYLEDLIGEGNVALAMGVTMLGALEHADEAQGALVKMVMDGMETYIAENAEESKKDGKIADKVNKVADAANKMYEEMHRKVTAQELAEETGMSVKAILDAVRMSGNKIESITEEEF